LGGGTSWNLSDDLGGGDGKTLQAGLHGSMRWDAFQAAAAMIYGFHDMSTARFTFGGDRLGAAFHAHSLGGRIEGGTRVETEIGGVIPYAALQVQTFFTPAYVEDDPGSSGFGLSYEERLVTAVRGELGARFDHTIHLEDDALLKLNARLAFAHDTTSGSSLTAAFQALPGASFTVNGAAAPENLALGSLGAEFRLNGRVSLCARFDGEFAPGSITYAGIGTIRVNW
jgi:outer membrane autotransporter protein